MENKAREIHQVKSILLSLADSPGLLAKHFEVSVLNYHIQTRCGGMCL